MKHLVILTLILFSLVSKGQKVGGFKSIENYYEECKPKNYKAYTSLSTGVQLLSTGQVNRALNHFFAAVNYDSTFCDSYLMISLCYQLKNQFDSSFKWIQKYTLRNGETASSNTIKGYTQLLSKDTLGAIKSFEYVMQTSKNRIDGFYGSALVYYFQGKKMLAIEVIDNFLSNHTGSIPLHELLKIKKLRKACEKD